MACGVANTARDSTTSDSGARALRAACCNASARQHGRGADAHEGSISAIYFDPSYMHQVRVEFLAPNENILPRPEERRRARLAARLRAFGRRSGRRSMV